MRNCGANSIWGRRNTMNCIVGIRGRRRCSRRNLSLSNIRGSRWGGSWRKVGGSWRWPWRSYRGGGGRRRRRSLGGRGSYLRRSIPRRFRRSRNSSKGRSRKERKRWSRSGWSWELPKKGLLNSRRSYSEERGRGRPMSFGYRKISNWRRKEISCFYRIRQS